MFVNEMALLVKFYKHVKLTTVEYIGKRTTSIIYKYLEKIMMFTIYSGFM